MLLSFYFISLMRKLTNSRPTMENTYLPFQNIHLKTTNRQSLNSPQTPSSVKVWFYLQYLSVSFCLLSWIYHIPWSFLLPSKSKWVLLHQMKRYAPLKGTLHFSYLLYWAIQMFWTQWVPFHLSMWRWLWHLFSLIFGLIITWTANKVLLLLLFFITFVS